MATRMLLVPEDQQALAYQQKINISPQVRSLSNLDALMQHILYNSKLPRRKRMHLYNQLRIRKQNILRQYGDICISHVFFFYILDSPESNKFIELEKVIQLQQQYNKAALGGNKQQFANNLWETVAATADNNNLQEPNKVVAVVMSVIRFEQSLKVLQ